MYSRDRKVMRQVYFDTWKKYQNHESLSSLEREMLALMQAHPEFHDIWEDPVNYLDKDFGEANPFFHLSLHLALIEQLSVNKPQGIREVYHALCQKIQDKHVVEHKMMEVLEEILYSVQLGQMPDEVVYLARLKEIC